MPDVLGFVALTPDMLDAVPGFDYCDEPYQKELADRTRMHDRSAGVSRFRAFAWMPHYLRWYVKALARLIRPQPAPALTVLLLIAPDTHKQAGFPCGGQGVISPPVKRHPLPQDLVDWSVVSPYPCHFMGLSHRGGFSGGGS